MNKLFILLIFTTFFFVCAYDRCETQYEKCVKEAPFRCSNLYEKCYNGCLDRWGENTDMFYDCRTSCGWNHYDCIQAMNN
jgi:hypothetical protein